MLKLSSPWITIIIFATYLSFLMVDMVNVAIPLFAVLAAVGITRRRIVRHEIWLWVFAALFLFSSLIVNRQQVRGSSLIYTCILIIVCINFFRGMSRGELSLNGYMRLCRILIFAYFFVLVFQQICVLAGIPVFNVILDYSESNVWKLSSLSDEPSHAARILALLAFSYLKFCRITRKSYGLKILWKNKKERYLWLAFLWTMLTMQSSTAILFVVILFIYFFMLDKIRLLHIIISVFFLSILVYNFRNQTLVQRNIAVIAATLTLDEKRIVEADNSGAHRIVPPIILGKQVSIFNYEGLWGHGMDSSKKTILRMFPGHMKEEVAGGGGSLQIWYEFGAFAFIVYVFGSIRYCTSSRDKMTYLFWFMLIFLNTLNTQITWLSIMLLAYNKYFLEKTRLGNSNKNIT